ncbi:hypothetical protein HUT19_25640 [Streptomyces sp. NA02950]|uniref:hypothetical protein n=1 Tax=Streptomyces sp. NA02950 TaxID=2742137 RepID=UPI00159019E6|nr:hypothetical protein [Streptomyces sp. NA02950]QKV94716.1 hypothetical protein HUT19_25640 [Streptomyces sp. NA02950]
MTENQALPLAIIFGSFCVLVVRSREVVWWVGSLFFAFGFVMASTTPGLTINDFLMWVSTYVLRSAENAG